MVDKKISELNEITSISGSAILYVLDSPGESTASKKITVENLFNYSPPVDILMIQIFS